MDGTYQMLHDIIDFHNDRMRNLRRYYPFFCLQNTAFHLFKEGKYAFLDMGYITLAVLRFFIEENQFNDRALQYPEIMSFLSGVLTRDFSLSLPKDEEKELTGYIFDKIKNDGKPFVMEYFDPVKKVKSSVRMKLIDATLSGNTVLYTITADAIEFYLDTKEIQDESKINIQQILLEKMIHTKNFKGGIDVIRRINSEVNRLRLQKKEVLALLGSNVFDGVKALEEFNRTGMRWFSEEQKLFSHNMELMQRARAKAEETVAGEKDTEALRGIYQLETELKKAMANHEELLSDCMDLQVRADEMIRKYKFSRLRGAFDFRGFVAAAEEAQDVTLLSHLVEPLLFPKLQKQFSLLQTDELLSLPAEAGEAAEVVGEAKEEMYRFEDEIEEERISGNYAAIVKTLFDELLSADRVALSVLNRKLELKFFDGIFRNSDYYSFLVHICQKKEYDLGQITKKQDTFFEGILAKLLADPAMHKYAGLRFCVIMKPEAEELIHRIAGLERDTAFVTTEIVFERMKEEKAG
ncbi:MAG: hypothetical protein PUC73_12140 [Lachnospiraceae bacterium]|nr:hypothetical protein [Lachnospiraceae bacterium]